MESLHNPFRRYLRGFDLEQAISYIAKCSVAISHQSDDSTKRYRHMEQIKGIERLSEQYDHKTTLPYLASEIIANARGSTLFGLDEFNHAIRLLPNTAMERYEQFPQSYQYIQILLSVSFPQRAISEGSRTVNRIGRYSLIYNEIGMGQGTNSMPHLINQFPNFSRGLSLREFMVIGMVVLAASLEQAGYIDLGNFTGTRVGETVISSQHVTRFLKVVSLTPPKFKDKMNRAISENFNFHTLQNPLLRFPVLRIGRRFIAPIPQLLLERCGEGIYEDFKTNLPPSDFDKSFTKSWGRTFEKYVQQLIEYTSLNWRVWSEIEYQGMKSCDLIILDGGDLILIECKSSPMNKNTKTWMSKDSYDHELKEKLAKGIETLVRTAKHLRTGMLRIPNLEIEHVNRFIGLIVTLSQ